MHRRTRKVARLAKAMGAGVAALALATIGLAPAVTAHADTLPPPGVPATATAEALPTWQITGVVWDQEVVGNTVYATGNFTKARPPGTRPGDQAEIDVAHLIAYDIRTGERLPSFTHTLDAQGQTLTASPDGKTLYVGGDFTVVDGKVRHHIAAFDVATGRLLDSFAPPVFGQVKAIAVHDGTVYAGGAFKIAANTPRLRLAAFRAADGGLLPWAPAAEGGDVTSLLVAPGASKLVIAGGFQNLNGQRASGSAAVTLDTGAGLPWRMNERLYVSSTAAITNLSTDGHYVYGGGYVFGQGSPLEGTFSADPADGSLRWVADCLGDTYDTVPVGGVMYVAGHAHDCTAIGGLPDTRPRARWQHSQAYTTEPTQYNQHPDAYGYNFTDVKAPSQLHWFPQMGVGTATGQYQASWTIEGNDDYIVAGGEFLYVNNRAQTGLTRFARTPGSRTAEPTYTRVPASAVADPVATRRGGIVSVTFPTAWDYDNERLTFSLVRDRGSAGEEVVSSVERATNFWTLPDLTLSDVGAPAGAHTYSIKVSDATGRQTWSAASNSVTITDAVALSPYAKTVLRDGAKNYWRLGETSGPATDLTGGVTGTPRSGVTRNRPGAISGDTDRAMSFNGSVNGSIVTDETSMSGPMSMEMWVRSTSRNGGRLLTLARTASSGGWWPTMTTTNERHLYMASGGRFGLRPNGSSTQIESPGGYNNGQWVHVVATVGASGMTLYANGEAIATDPSVTTTPNYTGRWYIGSDRAGTSTRVTGWSFPGDIDEVAVYGSALTAAQVAEHYRIGTGQAANTAPVAAFTSQVEGLRVSVDGAASSDADGTIASYRWDFGDSTPAVEGVKAEHTYATAGTYTVTLTVTDDKGATHTATRDVTVTASDPGDPQPAAQAADRFERAVASGWGTADAGGAWATQGSSSLYTVADGQGIMRFTPGRGLGAALAGLPALDKDVTVTFGYDKAATGGGMYTTLMARGDTTNGYGVRLHIDKDGVMRAFTDRQLAGAETILSGRVVPGVTHQAGGSYRVRVQVTGSPTTEIRVKVWPVGQEEPTAWLVRSSDATAALQAPGGVAVEGYLSGSGTALNLSVDDLAVQAPQ